MFERIKSIILALLVVFSVYLSFLLAGHVPPRTVETPPSVGGSYWGSGRSTLALLAPARLVLHSSERTSIVIYPGRPQFTRLWNQAVDVLQQLVVEELSRQPSSLSEWEAASDKEALELIFFFPLESEIWGPVLEYPVDLNLPWPTKRMLLVPGSKPEIYLASQGGEVIKYNLHSTELTALTLEDEPATLCRELEAPLEVSQTVYVPAEPLSLPVLRMSGEVVDQEIVAGSFFADLSLTRRIRERDGATIYSDGRRGVRVWADGSVEYNAPGVESGVGLPPAQALDRAVRFITQHGGWPPEVRLPRLTTVSPLPGEKRYLISFNQFWNGLPLAEPTLHVELSDRGVAKYQRSVLYSVGNAGWLEASSEGLEEKIRRANKLEKGDKIADVYLTYRKNSSIDEEVLLVPVWAVETAAGRVFWLEASGGEQG
ncbi:MAG: hypothetical protein GX062_03345 [Firmicutes bacterium]|nr:hypothetical protein [Bacillota bacterium]